MIRRITDYFIYESIKEDNYELFKSRVLVNFLQLMIIVATMMYVTVLMDAVEDQFPFGYIIILYGSLLFLFKYTGRRILVANLGILGTLIGTISNIFVSGGIYSFNIRWMILPIIIVFLISNRRSATIFLIMNIMVVFYFYQISTPDFWDDAQFPASTYLVDNLFFMVVISIIIYLFYIGQNKLANQIKQKNQILEQQNLTLKLQKEELDQITNELRESNQKLEKYGHHTAHDIIQPASTISNFVQLVVRDINKNQVTNKTKEFAELAQKSALSLIDMSRNLLSLAKADFEDKVQKEQIDLSIIVDQVKLKLADQITKADAQISCDKLPTILGFKAQMISMFQNLISNAIIYRKSNIPLKISIVYQERDCSHLIKIADNGIGIKSENLKDIFDSFHRVNQDGQTGTGLGLPICKQIVEQHGGQIWAESNFGIGTTFHIQLNKDLNPLKAIKTPSKIVA